MGGGARASAEIRVAASAGDTSVKAPDTVDLVTFRTVPQPPIKRVVDFVLAFVGLALTAPLWALIAIAIKLEDGGPILYIQKRWGRAGTTFELYKFRTMIVDSDERFGI